jgi:hypothetical protein
VDHRRRRRDLAQRVTGSLWWGSQIVWKNSTDLRARQRQQWWQWTGSSWTNVGWTIPGGTISGGGTTSPDGRRFLSTLRKLSIVPARCGPSAPRRDLAQRVTGSYGWGSQIVWKSSTIYVLGNDSKWWQWTGASLDERRSDDSGGTTRLTGRQFHSTHRRSSIVPARCGLSALAARSCAMDHRPVVDGARRLCGRAARSTCSALTRTGGGGPDRHG